MLMEINRITIILVTVKVTMRAVTKQQRMPVTFLYLEDTTEPFNF